MVSTRSSGRLGNKSESRIISSNAIVTRKSKNGSKTTYNKSHHSDGANNESNRICSYKKQTKKSTLSHLSSSEKFDLLLEKIDEISRKMSVSVTGDLSKEGKINGRMRGKKRGSCEKDDVEGNVSARKFIFSQSPPFIKGEMRDYQIFGLNWLLSLRESNINGILADEMGLGKTLQTISLIAYVKLFESKITGIENNLPSIIIVPLSTLFSWENEFKRWTNGIRVVVLHGDGDKRKEIVKNDLIAGKYDVALTTYEIFSAFSWKLKKITWEYVVVDEAHRIKNEETILAKGVRRLKANNRLLLTGTPLQNNLHELWSLLNFLQPELFDNVDDFDNWFDSDKCLINKESVVQKLHKILQPFMLRRIKKDVEKGLLPKKETTLFVGLSNVQKELYKKILLKDSEIIINGKITKAKLLGIMQQLRKVVSHPYLFPGIEPGPPYVDGDHMLTCCGKLNVLDKLLVKLKVQGSRVLIFSQFIGTLDILEDYMSWRKFSYHRFDGSTSHTERQEYIDEFQSKKSKTFAFLISTRAGGLGITLTAADIVIFYDVDWNPQVDLQAADRTHRIGQKKEVKVFRIIAEGTVDERIYETAEKKLRLDNLIIQKEIIRNGAGVVGNEDRHHGELDNDIESIIEKSSQKFNILKEKLDKIGVSQEEMIFDGFEQSKEGYSVYKFDGDDYKVLQKLNNDKLIKDGVLEKRTRSQRFSDLGQLEDDKNVEQEKTIESRKGQSDRKNPAFPPNYEPYKEHFLCHSKYIELADRYVAYFRKCQNFSFVKNGTINASESDLKKQKMIDDAKPLSDEDLLEMNKLKNVAFFSNWSQKDFLKIKYLMSSNGTDFNKIAALMPNYDINEVKRYGERLLQYAVERNMVTFLTQVRKADNTRHKKAKLQEYIDDLFFNACGDPLNVNMSSRMFLKKHRNVTHVFDLELDKHIFYHIISEIKKNNIDIGEICKENISPFVTLDFLNYLKRFVKSSQSYELNSNEVVRRFLNILLFIDNWISTDASNKLPCFNNFSHNRQRVQLNRVLLKPCNERRYVFQHQNQVSTSEQFETLSSQQAIFPASTNVVEDISRKRSFPFIENDGVDLKSTTARSHTPSNQSCEISLLNSQTSSDFENTIPPGN